MGPSKHGCIDQVIWHDKVTPLGQGTHTSDKLEYTSAANACTASEERMRPSGCDQLPGVPRYPRRDAHTQQANSQGSQPAGIESGHG